MQATVKATKPAASQILAAQRAAKKSKREERNLKSFIAPTKTDRNKSSAITSNLAKMQQENIAETMSSPTVSPEEAATCGIMLWLTLQDMRYARTQELLNFAEHIIRQVQRLAVYCNMDDHANYRSVDFACSEAHQAVQQWFKDFEQLSPNQRDIVLRPLRDLFAAYDRFLGEAPAKLIAEVSTYSLAVRVAKKSMRFLELDGGIITALSNVINGADSRSEARRLKIPYAEFTDRCLHAANLLYDVGMEADQALEQAYGKPLNAKRPQSIPDLRQPLMKIMCEDKGNAIVQAVKDAENLIRHCDNGSGISTFNWTKHYRRVANLKNLIKKDKT